MLGKIGQLLGGVSTTLILVQVAHIARAADTTHKRVLEFIEKTDARLDKAEAELARRRKGWW